jgi:hypothetical protein
MYDIKTQERSLVTGIVLDQALARCGSIMINPNSTSKSDKYIKAAKTTMLGYLQAMRGFSEDEDVETEQLYPQLTPELVDDMYKNCISFYEQVLKDLQENSSLLSADDIVKLQ